MRWKIIFFPIIGLLSSCYVTSQGIQQAKLLWSREPIEDAAQDQKINEDERKKLKFVQEVISYAEQEGLKNGGAYRHFVKLSGPVVTYTVQAAKPYEMKLKTWWFPFVGTVPYLGFFDINDRELEAQKLEEDGYEVHRGGATAFSSLGWFSDPVYSSMLRRSDVELAQLLFHELTHRTIWLKDGVEFNENLAEYVGDFLTMRFFAEKNRSQELELWRQSQLDFDQTRTWVLDLKKKLEEFYETSNDWPLSKREWEKSEILRMAHLNKPILNQTDFIGPKFWNNPRLLSFSMYAPDTQAFKEGAICFGRGSLAMRVGDFLKTLKELSEKTGQGFKALKAMCEPVS